MTDEMTETNQTGYEVTFEDFRRLVSDADYRESIAPLLRRWFGYEIDGAGAAARLLSPDGVETDMLAAHRQIQADSSRQYDFYQAAMSLWR